MHPVLAAVLAQQTPDFGVTVYLQLLAGVVALGVGIFMAIDAYKIPPGAWQEVGQSRLLWMLLPPVAGFACWPLLVVLAALWFGVVRKRLVEDRQPG